MTRQDKTILLERRFTDDVHGVSSPIFYSLILSAGVNELLSNFKTLVNVFCYWCRVFSWCYYFLKLHSFQFKNWMLLILHLLTLGHASFCCIVRVQFLRYDRLFLVLSELCGARYSVQTLGSFKIWIPFKIIGRFLVGSYRRIYHHRWKDLLSTLVSLCLLVFGICFYVII